MARQSCVVCAWRETCAKRFSVADGGSRCPDFSRDVTIKEPAEPPTETTQETSKEPTRR